MVGMDKTPESASCRVASARVGMVLSGIAQQGVDRFTASYVASLLRDVEPAAVVEALVGLSSGKARVLDMLCEAVCPNCAEPVNGIVPCDQLIGRDMYCEECGTEFELKVADLRYWFAISAGTAEAAKKGGLPIPACPLVANPR